jgi:phosphate transport system ATP-binding protein
MDIKLSIKNLDAYYGKNRVLKNISIDIPRNKVIAIIGPSGCGKSTFVRCLNRMHEVVGGTIKGSIELDGKDITNLDPVLIRKKMGMVFQKPNPFPSMSVFNNVAAGLKLNGFGRKKDITQVVEKCLKQAALWDEVKDHLNKGGMELSGGQQQRLCIARALAVNPEVLLMDEPASALDPISTTKIEDLIFDLKQNYTIIIVTHNMQQAARVSDYTAFFYMGDLIEYNETQKIFTQPDKKQTEDYVRGRFG